MFVENIDHEEFSENVIPPQKEDEEQEDMETDHPKLKRTKL